MGASKGLLTGGSFWNTLLGTLPLIVFLYFDEIDPFFRVLNGQLSRLLLIMVVDGHYTGYLMDISLLT